MITQFVRPSNLASWLRTNAAAQLTTAGGDWRQAWRLYLAANGGSGNSDNEMESNFLRAQGQTARSVREQWDKYFNALPITGIGPKNKAQQRYK